MDGTYANPGTEVILRKPPKHSPVPGYWISEMDFYIGKRARITRTTSRYGYLVCYVDVDQGACFWLVEDMILASDVPLLTPEQKIKLRIQDG